MDTHAAELACKLAEDHVLTLFEYGYLAARLGDAELRDELASLARAVREPIYGHGVFIRGLIEFSSFCTNDCLYCGLRASNAACERYRLEPEQILACTEQGHSLGFRTFVLQSGEDPQYSDERLCAIVSAIKGAHPDCAVTLSVGERTRESYRLLREAGVDRYLLRHETADPAHYARLHPASMSWDRRMRCLYDLRDLGYAVGCGFMVGSPYQTPAALARDLAFIQEFRPEMCGIGPFVPHHATPFADRPSGTLEQTLGLLSIIRLIHPFVLLPATTALATIDPCGRELGMEAGANVAMPNLSPAGVRTRYALYDGKACTGDEAAECRRDLDRSLESFGYRVVIDRGDPRGVTRGQA